jgi:hypothetical protein
MEINPEIDWMGTQASWLNAALECAPGALMAVEW